MKSDKGARKIPYNMSLALYLYPVVFFTVVDEPVKSPPVGPLNK